MVSLGVLDVKAHDLPFYPADATMVPFPGRADARAKNLMICAPKGQRTAQRVMAPVWRSERSRSGIPVAQCDDRSSRPSREYPLCTKTGSTSITAFAVRIRLFCAPVICRPAVNAALGGRARNPAPAISFAVRSPGTLA